MLLLLILTGFSVLSIFTGQLSLVYARDSLKQVEFFLETLAVFFSCNAKMILVIFQFHVFTNTAVFWPFLEKSFCGVHFRYCPLACKVQQSTCIKILIHLRWDILTETTSILLKSVSHLLNGLYNLILGLWHSHLDPYACHHLSFGRIDEYQLRSFFFTSFVQSSFFPLQVFPMWVLILQYNKQRLVSVYKNIYFVPEPVLLVNTLIKFKNKLQSQHLPLTFVSLLD